MKRALTLILALSISFSANFPSAKAGVGAEQELWLRGQVIQIIATFIASQSHAVGQQVLGWIGQIYQVTATTTQTAVAGLTLEQIQEIAFQLALAGAVNPVASTPPLTTTPSQPSSSSPTPTASSSSSSSSSCTSSSSPTPSLQTPALAQSSEPASMTGGMPPPFWPTPTTATGRDNRGLSGEDLDREAFRTVFENGQIIVFTPAPRVMSVEDFMKLYLLWMTGKTTFDEEQIKQLNTILRAMIQHSGRYRVAIEFENIEDAFRELTFRFVMVSQFSDLTECTRYNQSGDTYRLNPKFWISVPAYFKQGKSFTQKDNCAFQPTSSASPFKAMRSCYDKKIHNSAKNDNLLDCFGAVLTHTCRSIALTEGPARFDEIATRLPGFLTIAPEWALFARDATDQSKSSSTRRKTLPKAKLNIHPILTTGILAETTIEDLDQLLPGDILYFRNHPVYEKGAPTGWWAGEWTIYMGLNPNGQHIFAGLGAEDHTLAEMAAALREHFLSDTGRESYPETTEEDPFEEIIGGTFPAPARDILSMLAYRRGGALSSSDDKSSARPSEERKEKDTEKKEE